MGGHCGVGGVCGLRGKDPVTVVGLGDMRSKLLLRSDDTPTYLNGKIGMDSVPSGLST